IAAVLHPEAVLNQERVLLGQVVLEIAARCPVAALAPARLAGVLWVIEVRRGVTPAVEREAEGVPRQVDRAFAGLGIPAARLAGFALAALASMDLDGLPERTPGKNG